MQTTYTIEVTQGVTGPIIDRFTINLNDDLDVDEKTDSLNKRCTEG